LSLKQKTIAGLVWSFSQQFGLQAINFCLSIVIARLLDPSDYGLLGMLAIFMSVGQTLINSGMTSSLIRSKELTEDDYSTVFWMNLTLSIVIYLGMVIASPFIAAFFNQPILKPIIWVYCFTFVAGALAMVQKARLIKQMDFRSQMMISIPSLVIAGGLGLTLAYLDFGVWALIWMSVVQVSLNALFFWMKSGWKPKWQWSHEKMKVHFDFGYKITVAGILDAVFKNSYNLLIGKYFAVEQLGYYTKADSLKQLPVQNISLALDQVTYPLFASIQDENSRLKNAYKQLMQQVVFWLAPVLVFAAVLAEPLFVFLLTEKWLPAVPFFQILCVVGILYPLHSYNLNILKVKGRSDLFLKLEIIKKIPMIVGLAIAVMYGIFALLYLQIVLNVLFFFINSAYSGKMINYPSLEQLKDIVPSFLLVTFVGVILYSVDLYFVGSGLGNLSRIALGFLIGWALYLGISYLFKSPALFAFKALLVKK
jgi:teichuronic acid exporter